MFLDGIAPYSLAPQEKQKFLLPELLKLQEHHAARCPEYAHVVANWREHAPPEMRSPTELPYLPVTVFKDFELRSAEGPSMQLRSSATTSGSASKVYADRITRRRQALSANMVWRDFLGPDQRPYIVFDTKEAVSGTSGMSARGAAILSLAHLASEWHFVMRQEGEHLVLDIQAFQEAVELIGSRHFMAYGFTYLLYQAHCQLRDSGMRIHAAHPDSVLIHSGGWKRLENIKVDKQTMHNTVAGVWRLPATRVVDFYGVVEQVGVPFPDCPQGYKHVPYWADIVIRRTDTCEPARQGEVGLIQLMNCLPLGAPNHSVLTEDMGQVVLEDGCPCGRRGRAFAFRGRAPRSELRGCSDAGADHA